MNDKNLIEQVKIAKALGKVKTFAEIAHEIGMKPKSFYNFVNGFCSLGYDKKRKLIEFLGGNDNETL